MQIIQDARCTTQYVPGQAPCTTSTDIFSALGLFGLASLTTIISSPTPTITAPVWHMFWGGTYKSALRSPQHMMSYRGLCSGGGGGHFGFQSLAWGRQGEARWGQVIRGSTRWQAGWVARFGSSGMWCLRMLGLTIIVYWPSTTEGVGTSHL